MWPIYRLRVLMATVTLGPIAAIGGSGVHRLPAVTSWPSRQTDETDAHGSCRLAIGSFPPSPAVHERSLVYRFLDAGNTEAGRTLGEPASKKRRCTKSRDAGQRLGGEHYGDFSLALHLMEADPGAR